MDKKQKGKEKSQVKRVSYLRLSAPPSSCRGWRLLVFNLQKEVRLNCESHWKQCVGVCTAKSSLFSPLLISLSTHCVFFLCLLYLFFKQHMLLACKASSRKLKKHDRHHSPLWPNAVIFFHFSLFAFSLSVSASVTSQTWNACLCQHATIAGLLTSHLHGFISTHTTFK